MRKGYPDARGLHYGLMMAALEVGLVVAMVGGVLPVCAGRIVAVGRGIMVVMFVTVFMVAGLSGEDCSTFMAGPACRIVGARYQARMRHPSVEQCDEQDKTPQGGRPGLALRF